MLSPWYMVLGYYKCWWRGTRKPGWFSSGRFFFLKRFGCTIWVNQNPWFIMHAHHWLCNIKMYLSVGSGCLETIWIQQFRIILGLKENTHPHSCMQTFKLFPAGHGNWYLAVISKEDYSQSHLGYVGGETRYCDPDFSVTLVLFRIISLPFMISK